MKKRMLAAAVAAMITMSTGIAMAAPVELDGSVSVQYRQNTKTGEADTTGSKYTFVLNAKTNVEKNLNFFARFGAQGVTKAGFGNDFKDDSKNFVGEVDQFGFVYNNAGVTYKIGRQAATIGGQATLYSIGGNIGKHAFVDGITVEGKSGVTALNLVAAQEDNDGANDNKLYALHASFSPEKNLTLGATVAKYDYADATADTNHWAVDAAYVTGKATVFGEYAKSNAAANNKAYNFGVSYSIDDKNSVYVISHRTEANADMGGKTDFDNGEKGFYYGFGHKFNKSTSLSLFYKDNKKIADTSKENTSFRTTLDYKF